MEIERHAPLSHDSLLVSFEMSLLNRNAFFFGLESISICLVCMGDYF
jgi:hypothetical protein